jgi:tRNA-(ms[2]io[6]A)-hydroxylase
MMFVDLNPIHEFLGCQTPTCWIDSALAHPEELLIDHANCEKKAASTAMSLLYKYVDNTKLLTKMSQLAREELLHFEQVVTLMRDRGVNYRHLTPSRYASGLRSVVRAKEPERLIDILLIGAFVEARSCERFAALLPYLDKNLQKFYRSLLRSEARHFADYLELAGDLKDEGFEKMIVEIRNLEQSLIESPDETFRFHSGPISLRSSQVQGYLQMA